MSLRPCLIGATPVSSIDIGRLRNQHASTESVPVRIDVHPFSPTYVIFHRMRTLEASH